MLLLVVNFLFLRPLKQLLPHLGWIIHSECVSAVVIVIKILLTNGSEALAVLKDDQYLPLDLSQVDDVGSLSDILHAPDPVGLANYLVDTKVDPLGQEDLIVLAPIDRQSTRGVFECFRVKLIAFFFVEIEFGELPLMFTPGDCHRVTAFDEPSRLHRGFDAGRLRAGRIGR